MTAKRINPDQSLPRGVIFNAYPDSIGRTLCDTMQLLAHPQMKGAFSLFYVLPTFFNRPGTWDCLDQLKLLKLRNSHPAFSGKLEITGTVPHRLHLTWRNGDACAILEAGLRGHGFTVSYSDNGGDFSVMRFAR